MPESPTGAALGRPRLPPRDPAAPTRTPQPGGPSKKRAWAPAETLDPRNSHAARRAGLRRPRCCSSRKNRHAHARRAHPAMLLAARCEEQPAAHGPPAFASFGPLQASGGGGRTLMVSRIDGRRGCTCSFKQTGAQLRCTARLVNHSLFRARAGGASRRHDRRRLLSASRTFRVSGGD